MAQALCWTMTTNVLRFLKYSVLKRSGQMCSAAFITLGCVLCVEMIIVITRWKAADERLSLPLMSYLSTPAWCRVHRFCFWMIYCCVKVAYVLLKLALVNDSECVLNTGPAMGAVFSHLHLWERQSWSPPGAQRALPEQCLGASVLTLHISIGIQLDTNHFKSFWKTQLFFLLTYSVDKGNCSAWHILNCFGFGCISHKTFHVLK